QCLKGTPQAEQMKAEIGRGLLRKNFGETAKGVRNKIDFFFVAEGKPEAVRESFKEVVRKYANKVKTGERQMVIYSPPADMLGFDKIRDYAAFIGEAIDGFENNVIVIPDAYTDLDKSIQTIDDIKDRSLPDPTARYLAAVRFVTYRYAAEDQRDDIWKGLIEYLKDITGQEEFTKPDNVADWKSWFEKFTQLRIRPIDYKEISDYIETHTAIVTAL
ncbi:MAG: hypothetical protein PHS37_08935, partial [Candidatus Omnitrophica bacterium]|nr:hypothetical protein [Candidatus Omnitrophota bacterium]